VGGRDPGAGVRPVGRHSPLHGPADHRRYRQQEGVQVSVLLITNVQKLMGHCIEDFYLWIFDK
jgi:hypothetical protein